MPKHCRRQKASTKPRSTSCKSKTTETRSFKSITTTMVSGHVLPRKITTKNPGRSDMMLEAATTIDWALEAVVVGQKQKVKVVSEEELVCSI